jgi:pimeloyl-ACP methyl ester carboxylesterase
VLLLILGGAIFLLPAEKTPQTGRWLTRAGLESRVVTLPRGDAGALPGGQVGQPSQRLDIRYVRAGTGPTVILIHGLASSIYSWADVIGPLSAKFDVVAIDLPGFGASSQPGDLSFDDNPQAVVRLMDVLGIEKAHFVGNSMGGALSLFLAARHPTRVDRVIVLDAAGFAMKPDERPFLVQLLASGATGAIAERLPVRRGLTRAALNHLIRDRSRVTEERIDEYVAPLQRPGALEATRSLLRSRFDERFVADLGLIRAKTLVVWGRFDPWLPLEDADRFVAAIGGARKVVLETGHMPQEEKPAEVAQLIGEFLIS